jgi:GH24 family phage-related lysozyme (muramidase)
MIDWSGRTEKALPNTEFLSRQCFGVLVSLTFNRGENIYRLPDDRYTEARMIRRHMINKEYDKIPIEIRSMKRLYPNSKGLRQRREEEANLFTLGLTI